MIFVPLSVRRGLCSLTCFWVQFSLLFYWHIFYICFIKEDGKGRIHYEETCTTIYRVTFSGDCLYLLVEAKRKFNVAEIAWSPIFVLLYLLFDYIRFRFVGSFVYGLFPTEKMSLLNAMVIGIIMYILGGICLANSGQYFANCSELLGKSKER